METELNCLLIDTRTSQDYNNNHYPESLNVSLKHFEDKKIEILEKYKNNYHIVIVGYNDADETPHEVAHKLISLCYKFISVLESGYEGLLSVPGIENLK